MKHFINIICIFIGITFCQFLITEIKRFPNDKAEPLRIFKELKTYTGTCMLQDSLNYHHALPFIIPSRTNSKVYP